MKQKKCNGVKFTDGLGIYYYGYPERDEQEKYNRPIRKVTVEASQKGWLGLSVEKLRKSSIVHVPQVGYT